MHLLFLYFLAALCAVLMITSLYWQTQAILKQRIQTMPQLLKWFALGLFLMTLRWGKGHSIKIAVVFLLSAVLALIIGIIASPKQLR